MATAKKTIKREVRHRRIRSKAYGVVSKPRLAVFRSNKYLYAQIINDEKGETLASASSLKMKGSKMEVAKKVGEEIAKAGIAKKVKEVVFDRGGFNYAGVIKVLADSAREGGLKF